MKRLILFLGLILLGAMVFAQSTARTALQRTLPKGVTYLKYSCAAADTAGTGQDTLYFEIMSNKNCPLNCNARVEATRTGTSEDYEIRLQGKVFENDSWTSLVDSTAQTASLSLYHPDVQVDKAQAGSTNSFYRYFRILIGTDGTCGAADKLTINYVIFKLYER